MASFPGACFSSFIAANSFKTVMPKINPFLSVGIGALVSMILAITGVAGNLQSVFGIIGASFGPICGAMAADYLLAGKRWTGPAGFNPAGWISWAVGFFVGVMPVLHNVKSLAFIPDVPATPVAAFIVGFALYFVCTKLGVTSAVVPMENRADAATHDKALRCFHSRTNSRSESSIWRARSSLHEPLKGVTHDLQAPESGQHLLAPKAPAKLKAVPFDLPHQPCVLLVQVGA